MKSLTFHYHLQINLDAPVSRHSFTLKCCPSSDNKQRISNLKVQIQPDVPLVESVDQFGNSYFFGDTTEPHTLFDVNVTGDAATGLSAGVPEVHEFREHIYRYQTGLTEAGPELKKVVERFTGKTELEAAQEIMDLLKTEMVYTPGATQVNTTAEQAFTMRQGVCQDYSHIMISLLRELGICARYVVGMMIGEGESHAWVEVKAGQDWYGFDPTNDVTAGDDHVKISHGRDYKDCMINNGFFYGWANQTQEVSVIVSEKE